MPNVPDGKAPVKSAGKSQDHVAENAAEAARQRPGDRRGNAAESGGGKHRAAEPGGRALEDAVEGFAEDQYQCPGNDGKQRDDAGDAEELHEDIGEGRTGITEDVGRGISGRIGEARIGDVPGR